MPPILKLGSIKLERQQLVEQERRETEFEPTQPSKGIEPGSATGQVSNMSRPKNRRRKKRIARNHAFSRFVSKLSSKPNRLALHERGSSVRHLRCLVHRGSWRRTAVGRTRSRAHLPIAALASSRARWLASGPRASHLGSWFFLRIDTREQGLESPVQFLDHLVSFQTVRCRVRGFCCFTRCRRRRPHLDAQGQ